MSTDEFKKIVAARGLVFKKNGGEKFVTPDLKYAQDKLRRNPKEYQVIAEFKLAQWSWLKFVAHGQVHNSAAQGGLASMPKIDPPWTEKPIVMFKLERGALNLGFGPGSAHLFNSSVRSVTGLQ